MMYQLTVHDTKLMIPDMILFGRELRLRLGKDIKNKLTRKYVILRHN